MKKFLPLPFILLVIIGVSGSVFVPSSVQANTGSGWEVWLSVFMGRTTKCAAGQSERDFALVSYTNSQRINPQGTRVKLQVVERNPDTSVSLRVVSDTGFVNAVSVTPTVCYFSDTQSVRVIVATDSTSMYHPYLGAGWWFSVRSARRIESGNYFRGYAHMQPKTMRPTLEVLAPGNTFITTARPGFIVASNDVSLLYGATQFKMTFLDFWANGARYQRYSIQHGGGVGVRTFSPANFADGFYTMTATQYLDGAYAIQNNNTSVRPLVDVPVGTLTKPVNFIVDTRVPQATINVTGTTSATNALANITLTAMDRGSGLRQVRAVLIPDSALTNVATMTVPFTVGAGLSGGPKELQTIRANVTLLPNTDYRYYVVATDVAGNVFRSLTQTMRTGEVYPDLDANNFRILNTCLPSYVGANLQAMCPSTAVEIRMNNIGGRNIPAGTSVSYRIESQLPTDPSSAPWQSVITGNYTAGLLSGAQSTPIPLTLANVQGGSRLRLAVNLAPQLNVSINERNFSNNISSPLTLTFTQAPPQLLLVADRALVRVNDTVNLRWEITSPYTVSCELQDGGSTRSINHVSGTTRGNADSSPLINFRIITLSCTSPTGEVTKTSVTVSVVPLVQEV